MGKLRNRRKNNSLKNTMILILIVVLVLMATGYSLYSSNLDINPVGKILGDWDLRFTNAILSDATKGANEVNPPIISEDGLTLDVSVELTYSDDIILYDVDITNFSEMFDATYMGIDIDYSESDPFIIWQITGIEVGDIINADTIKTIGLTAVWDSSKADLVPEATINNPHVETATLTLTFQSAKPDLDSPINETTHPLITDLLKVENFVASHKTNPIGTPLSPTNTVNIEGITYGTNWHVITKAQLAAEGIYTEYAPYIVKYSSGAVQSVPGAIVDNNLLHTLNYTGEEDGLYVMGLLTGVDAESTRTDLTWGQMTIMNGTAQYDTPFEGLILGDQIAVLNIDQSKPVNQKFSINVTVKGAVPQTLVETFPRTIVAISDQSGSYLSWIGIRGKYLHIYSFYPTSARASIDREETLDGFTSIDLTKSEYGFNFNNNYLNIQVTAELNGLTNIYLNGTLFKTINSGSGQLTYGRLTVGDLRSGRNLKYEGTIYNLALYSEILNQSAVTQNWDYAKLQLGL